MYSRVSILPAPAVHRSTDLYHLGLAETEDKIPRVFAAAVPYRRLAYLTLQPYGLVCGVSGSLPLRRASRACLT